MSAQSRRYNSNNATEAQAGLKFAGVSGHRSMGWLQSHRMSSLYGRRRMKRMIWTINKIIPFATASASIKNQTSPKFTLDMSIGSLQADQTANLYVLRPTKHSLYISASAVSILRLFTSKYRIPHNPASVVEPKRSSSEMCAQLSVITQAWLGTILIWFTSSGSRTHYWARAAV